ncbi:MAG: 50S ribosomal protein L19e [Candidatus Bathyarchaeota archaeon]|nr:50S ribosomal protein L19e [Candidatus Termiticorpusculum sp.]MCL1970961.1 50S ribosomal protein L19e [Candidatus Termiticorpusculum sp.]
MTNLTSQRRLASSILKVGENRVWIDPARVDDVDGAITREEIKKLIYEKVIVSLPEKGVSRSRAKVIREKKRKGRRQGPGSYTGSPKATVTKKEAWMLKVRSLRRKIRELKANRTVTEETYTEIYRMIGSGRFESIADMERYLKAKDLWRKR